MIILNRQLSVDGTQEGRYHTQVIEGGGERKRTWAGTFDPTYETAGLLNSGKS